MGKKIWYSKPLAKQWEIYQKESKITHETPVQFANRKLLNVSTNFSITWNQGQLESFLWELFLTDATQIFLHLYFIDKELKTFLENMPLPDLTGINKYLSENGYFSKSGNFQVNSLAFGIHIPYENMYKAYAFNLMNGEDNSFVLAYGHSNGGGWFSEYNYNKLIDDKSEEAENLKRTFRLAVNTIAYMEAFPDCVKEGVPEFVKDELSEKTITLSVSEKVMEINESDRVVSPHFRRGYFKRLSSDFYKNKKGQLVFVKETMVKGNAKTVYTDESIELK